MTRVTERSRYDATNNRINQVRALVNDTQEIAVSGRKLRKVSDDPMGAMQTFKNRTQLTNLNQYRKTIDFAQGFLARSEEALLGINDNLIRVKELAIQQANAPWDGQSRSISAKEIRQITDNIISLGNTTYGDRYVFGGFQTSLPSLDDAGNYCGDDGSIYVQVDEDGFKPVNVNGREIFDVAPDNEDKQLPLIKNMRQMVRAMESNDVDGLRKCMVDLDLASDRVIKSAAMLGARRNTFDKQGQTLDLSEEQLVKDSNRIEGADMIKTALDMKRAETALQYTLSSSAKILTPSLMNYLQ